MDSNDGVLKQDFHSIRMKMVGICTMLDRISKQQPTSVELVLKIWRKKIEESQLSSGSKDFFRMMEEDTLCYSRQARIDMLFESSDKNLNKRLHEAVTPENYNEDRMEKLRKIQDATTRPQNNDPALFLGNLEKYKDNYTKMLTKMQQDVYTAFDCFLERLRNTQKLKEENQNPVSVNHTMDSGYNGGVFKTEIAAIKMEMDRVRRLIKDVSRQTKYMKRFKKILRKEKEEGKHSGHEHLVRFMEEAACHAFVLAQPAIISRLDGLSMTLHYIACCGYEKKLEIVRKMQQDLESSRKMLDKAFSSYYAQNPNQLEMLTMMQEDVSDVFNYFLKRLRSMVVEQIDYMVVEKID